ncbi:GNAT family N-acetyltransferase [Algisphaera agarilytica]|uniref:Ribosomal-protein-serine acetyltransferase n=1 Tax=Algisphaera agarilytica TaxID=1385975 RepID=A0A7X0H9D0_9BACT|nr:GNAT family protein [Algisphaera agarilytica]MBB6430521.1 ribosomal-protein-serine acetyltransferase [Algisphaera agarilytica]
MSLLIPVDDEVSLRLVQPHHAEEIYAAAMTSQESLYRWMPWCKPDLVVDDTRKWIATVLKEFGERKTMPLSVLEHGELVGGCGWSFWDEHDNTDWNLRSRTADIGYWLIDSARGRGIMTRAVRALVDYGFKEQGLHRITIRAEPENHSSWGVPERLGFTLEGTMRHVLEWNGRRIDHRCYAMIAEDWRDAQG